MSLLDQVNTVSDLRKLPREQLTPLAEEIRSFIIHTVSRTGGHLASSLGVVELTIALHYIFNTPEDQIIWDVGHQAYTHKILTGRKDRFHTIRQYDGLSGFPRREESEFDAFNVGHSSTSISAALGFAVQRDLLKNDNKVLAVIGDGALTAGLAFEGLNNAGSYKKNLIVILNDNKMSISDNVGGISKYLTDILTYPQYNKMKDDIWDMMEKSDFTKDFIRPIISKIDRSLKNLFIPGSLFEEIGFRYFGPIDGHDIPLLLSSFNKIKSLNGPILIHVITKKGKGYEIAENNCEKYHGVSGTINKKKIKSPVPTYTQVFGETITQLAEKNPSIVGITAAMGHHGGFAEFQERFPHRFFDVGIAEQHAVTFASALAIDNKVKPVVMIYNTFLQRAFDSLIHDTALHNADVLFAIDRTGLVGADGPTHHGSFGFSFLRMIPNFTIAVPRNENMLRHLLYTGSLPGKGPFVVLYPRGCAEGVELDENLKEIPPGYLDVLKEGKDMLIFSTGKMTNYALTTAEILEDKFNINVTLVDLVYLKPLDEDKIRQLLNTKAAKNLLTLEENSLIGGMSSSICEIMCDNDHKVKKTLRLGLPDQFITHGSPKELHQQLSLLPFQIVSQAIEKFFPGKIKACEKLLNNQ